MRCKIKAFLIYCLYLILSKMVDTLHTQQIQKLLVEDAGMSPKTANVYMTLLKMGEISASAIAKFAGIKRTTVYNILPDLLHQGLIKKYRHKNKTLYYVEQVSDLLDRAKEKILGIEKIVPALKNIQAAKTTSPKIQFFEGRDGTIQLWKHMIDYLSPGEELLSILGSTNYEEILPQHVLEHYTRERSRKNCNNRIITNDSNYIRKLFKNTGDVKRTVKIVDSRELDFKSEIRIFGDKISVISYEEDFMGAIIHSKPIAEMHRAMFERFWDSV